MKVPVLEGKLSDQTVKDGDKVLLECSISGSPQPAIVWFKGSNKLKPSHDFKQV